MAAKRIEPVPEAPLVDYIGDRIGIWLAIGAFGAALGTVVAELFERTGVASNGLAGILAATAVLALAAVAEPAIRVRTILDKQNAELKRTWLTPPPGE